VYSEREKDRQMTKSPYSIQSYKEVITVVSLVGITGIWWIIAAMSVMVPSPLEVFNAFITLSWRDGTSPLFDAAVASSLRILTASVLVIIVGVPIGILMGASPLLDSLISPILDPFRSAPVVALLPLFVIWLGIDETMKIAFLFTGAVIYLIPMVRDAMKAVPYPYWEMIKDLGGTPWECVRHGMLPIAAPRIADAVITCFSIMWTYITVAEYVNASSGLGQLIQNARRFSALDQVIAGIITIIVLSFLTFKLLSIIRRKAFAWEVYK
jgi:ABC-type nitrate/sulfonate/bicarbonate transport system permease component